MTYDYAVYATNDSGRMSRRIARMSKRRAKIALRREFFMPHMVMAYKKRYKYCLTQVMNYAMVKA